MELFCKVKYIYDRPFFDNVPFVKNMVQNSFLKLRSIAVERLNPLYEGWNKAYTGPMASVGDKLADFGGTEYCKYIQGKQTEILNEVNRKYSNGIVKLFSDETGDICGRVNLFGKVANFKLRLYDLVEK